MEDDFFDDLEADPPQPDNRGPLKDTAIWGPIFDPRNVILNEHPHTEPLHLKMPRRSNPATPGTLVHEIKGKGGLLYYQQLGSLLLGLAPERKMTAECQAVIGLTFNPIYMRILEAPTYAEALHLVEACPFDFFPLYVERLASLVLLDPKKPEDLPGLKVLIFDALIFLVVFGNWFKKPKGFFQALYTNGWEGLLEAKLPSQVFVFGEEDTPRLMSQALVKAGLLEVFRGYRLGEVVRFLWFLVNRCLSKLGQDQCALLEGTVPGNTFQNKPELRLGDKLVGLVARNLIPEPGKLTLTWWSAVQAIQHNEEWPELEAYLTAEAFE